MTPLDIEISTPVRAHTVTPSGLRVMSLSYRPAKLKDIPFPVFFTPGTVEGACETLASVRAGIEGWVAERGNRLRRAHSYVDAGPWGFLMAHRGPAGGPWTFAWSDDILRLATHDISPSSPSAPCPTP